MRVRLSWLVAVAVAASVVLCVWLVLSPTPEQAIRRRLGEVARTASFGPNEGPLAKMMNADKLASFFAKDVEIRLDLGSAVQRLNGRDMVRNAAQTARTTLSSLKVDFRDLNVFVGPGRQTAEVDLTAVGSVPGEPDALVSELKFLLRKSGGEWVIRRVETVKTLR
jgi:hypothetical protein